MGRTAPRQSVAGIKAVAVRALLDGPRSIAIGQACGLDRRSGAWVCTTRRSVYWPALWRGLTAGSAPSPSARLSSRSLHESPPRIRLLERSLREDRRSATSSGARALDSLRVLQTHEAEIALRHPRQRFDGAIGSRKYFFQTLHYRFKFLRRRTAAQAESDRAHADLWTHAHCLQDW